MAPGTMKEEKSETSIGRTKKRSAPSTTSTAEIPSKENLHSEILKLEEQQARDRPSEMDAEVFRNTIEEVKGTLEKVLDIKVKGQTKTLAGDLTEHRTQASLNLLTLKKLNRLDQFRTKNYRDTTNKNKQKVDALDLKLQNLLYEVMHLQKEISKCQQFKSEDEDMNLVPLNEFYAKAPEEISNPSVTQSDPHQQRLARLQFENKQRREMNDEFKTLEDSKLKLEKKIRDKREKLGNLDPQLRKILEVAKPVESFLNMPISENKEQLDISKYLPSPLFVLYRQTHAYGEACDKNLKVKILGDPDTAQAFKYKDWNKEDDDQEGADDGAEEQEVQKKKPRGKRVSESDDKKPMTKQDERLQQLLAFHPLKVEVTVVLPEGGHSIILTFGYLYQMKVVSVDVNVQMGNDAKSYSGDEECLQSGNLLSHLFTCDPGTSSPNPGTLHQLSTIGLKNIPASQMATLGFFYRWAQELSGIEFPLTVGEVDVKTEDDNVEENNDKNESQEVSNDININEEIAQTKVKEVVDTIRQRLSSRLALQRQISLLEKAKMVSVDLPVPDEMASHFPTTSSGSRVASKIRNWSSVDWEQYTALQVTQHLVQSGCVDSHDFLFRMQANRDPASLIALIAIKPDYPKKPPVFCLNLHWRGEHNIRNSEHIRALETLINTEYEDIPTSCLPDMLSIQLNRLLICLDVLLESWNAAEPNEGKIDFNREKIFLQPIRGRTRSLPLMYNPNLKLFTQL